MSATPAQLADWQQRYDVLYQLTVGEATAYLHAPKRKLLLLAVERHRRAPLRLLVYLLHSCWLGGAPELKVKDDGQESPLFMAVMEAMAAHLDDWAAAL